MSLNRPVRSLASWFAMLAILLAALAPSISHALGPQAAAGWVEICTAKGTSWVQGDTVAGLSASDVPETPVGEHALEQCPFCSIHPNTVGIPPAPLLILPDADLAHGRPTGFLSAPSTRHAWTSAQPRAPPQRS